LISRDSFSRWAIRNSSSCFV